METLQELLHQIIYLLWSWVAGLVGQVLKYLLLMEWSIVTEMRNRNCTENRESVFMLTI